MSARKSLADWLDYQQLTHPRAIELGLERVREVWQRMGAPRPAPVVITVGGTNGKGSTVAFLEAMLSASGRRVGCYTSPHLLRYNERVRVLGADAEDGALIDAFERIEQARAEIPLTYFEFGTLAALWLFAQSKLDVAVLEVGLGGRLDAVNIVDADAAIVTTVDLDHQDWLGNDRDSIGREKAGIFRAGRAAVIGMHTPPQGLLAEAARIGARVLIAGRDFTAQTHGRGWTWRREDSTLELPPPSLAAECQIDNAAAAITALHELRPTLPWNEAAIRAGVRAARVPARLQRFVKPGAAELVVDVGHNPQAAAVLAQWLARQVPTSTVAVFGALSDKDIEGIVAPFGASLAQWHLASLDVDTARGLSAAALRERAPQWRHAAVFEHRDVAAALSAAAHASADHGRILAFGSFFVAAPALAWATENGYAAAS